MADLGPEWMQAGAQYAVLVDKQKQFNSHCDALIDMFKDAGLPLEELDIIEGVDDIRTEYELAICRNLGELYNEQKRREYEREQRECNKDKQAEKNKSDEDQR